jgi:hypothetical protein
MQLGSAGMLTISLVLLPIWMKHLIDSKRNEYQKASLRPIPLDTPNIQKMVYERRLELRRQIEAGEYAKNEETEM